MATDNTPPSSPNNLRYRLGRLSGKIFLYGTLLAWGFIAIIPFVWMLSTSVMSLGEAIRGDLVTELKLLEKFEITEEELNIPLSEKIPDFIRETDQFTPGDTRKTALDYIESRDGYLRIGDSVYRGGLINYVVAWQIAEFNEYVVNSIQITTITLSGELFISILAAYAFARMKWPGRDLIFGFLLSTIMIPGMVLIIPNFITVTWFNRIGSEALGYLLYYLLFTVQLIGFIYFVRYGLTWFRQQSQKDSIILLAGSLLGAGITGFYGIKTLQIILANTIEPIPWINNWPALTIPFMGSIFAIFLLRQFFSQIPDDLFDAAQIDGANHWQFLWQVVVPLSAAPILVITVLSFIGTWNALAWPLLVTNTPDWRPIAVGLYSFVDREAGSAINLQMAGSVITIIPILILYFFTQKQFTESIARTGMKG